MSDYPRLPMLRDSSAEVLSGHEPVRATNGALHMRRMFSAEKRDFVLLHILTADNRAALEAHYTANKDAQFTLYWPETGQNYTVSYAAAPQYDKAGMRYSRARVTLMER